MVSEQFGVLGTLGAGYLSTFTPDTRGPGGGVEVKGKGGYAALTPGIIFFPIPKFGISASIGNLGYERVSLERRGDADSESASANAFGANFGLNQLQFGGTFFFGR